MKLQHNYLDLLEHFRPHLLEEARKDAKRLLSTGPMRTIRSVDDYDSSIESVFNRAVRDAMKEGILNSQVELKGYLVALNAEFHAILNWSLNEERVFLYSDGLVDQLLHTEVNVNSDAIKVPFDSFAMVFQTTEAIEAFHQGGARPRSLGGTITVFATVLPPVPELPSRRLSLVSFHSEGLNSYKVAQRALYLPDEWTLEQALETDWDKINPNQKKSFIQGINISLVDDEFEGGISDERFYRDGKRFYRLVLNAILYLSSKDPELQAIRSTLRANLSDLTRIKNPAKREKASRRLRQDGDSAFDFIIVGASTGMIQVDPAEHEGSSVESVEPGHKINRRFIVRGHWRNQAIGEGRKERKLIWIKPFYKGPDLAEMVRRPYIVK